MSIAQRFTFILSLLASTQLYSANLGTPDPYDIEYPDDEEHSAEEIELGKVLFFDTRLSINKMQSCATCHNPDLGFGDGLTTSIGAMGDRVGRNAPHIYNLAWSTIFFWDGRSPTLEDQALGPIEAAGEMNLPLDKLMPRLESVPFYVTTFGDIYEDGLTLENVGRAIAAFERSIVSDNSPFDQYIKGNFAAMSPNAVQGLELFKGKANCTKCHDGPNFTDDSFHNIGVSPVEKDLGRAAIIDSNDLKGAFKTPGLRNVALTAPYMHDGSEGTLEEVVEFYNKGGTHKENISSLIVPLELSDYEVTALVEFLGALTDPVVIERPQVP